ncbi:phosphatidate cytidylyltransferase [Cytobacillus purgationiresistens]|uniref:Phosphatidate cytidylyltransferase n=1 Tax=Cytobacillus purgationiresistens TaxID=863449 RepID=A0ABU0AG13_9BACI|nr:phosphatidate cytidylyltransferase [Cytobacillus purgationiresistens]MDQ0270194.1 phosphatidate cytidylyltransferase [Cytobacillus purgationiresistens]
MKQRIITAIIFVAILIPLVILGGVPLMILAYFLATVGLFELMRMRKHGMFSIPGIISLLLLWLLLLPKQYEYVLTDMNFSKMDFLLIGGLLLLTYSVISKNRFTYDDVAFTILSTIYIGLGFHYFFETREAVNGLTFIFYSLFIIWATDSGAYFIGKSFGKRKLWPEISPNKTVEGSLGGVASALVVAILFAVFTEIDATLLQLTVITIILSVFGQIGDLAESAFKRHYGVKDSGNILPGHGGILDRFDSLLFVWPLLHILHLI